MLEWASLFEGYAVEVLSACHRASERRTAALLMMPLKGSPAFPAKASGGHLASIAQLIGLPILP